MPPTFGWDNLDDIAIALTDKFPDTDPLTVRFTDMHKWITELPGFSGDPAALFRELLATSVMTLRNPAGIVAANTRLLWGSAGALRAAAGPFKHVWDFRRAVRLFAYHDRGPLDRRRR